MADSLLRTTDHVPALQKMLSPTADLSQLMMFLHFRERGLRREMGSPLKMFAEQAALWSFDDRRNLVRWIAEPWLAAAGDTHTSSFAKGGDPVFVAVVAPTLSEWEMVAPENGEATLLACLFDATDDVHKWGRIGCLHAVTARNPELLPARRAWVRAVVDTVGFNQHEWPHGYLGDPGADLSLIVEAERSLGILPTDAWHALMTQYLRNMRDLASSAIERSATASSTYAHAPDRGSRG